MHRLFLFFFLFVSVGLGLPAGAAPADELPARPSPFRFVNDQAQLLTEANVKTLENGLRRYADNTGTQIVVVTVPTLGGRDVADYGRALGEAWGIGQRDKNNGIVLLLSGQERKVTIQAGSGLRSAITPELTARVINQDMTPRFKQGNYFAGLRAGLNTLMLAANPESNPRNNQPATASEPLAGTGGAATNPDLNSDIPAAAAPQPAPAAPVTPAEPESSGLGMGTLAIGALLIGGIIWLITRMFRRRSAAPAPAAGPVPSSAPDFLPNRSTGPYNQGGQQAAPDFLPNRAGGGGLGSGMGGVLMTGAAAAAGAYLGNRMASGHDTPHQGEPLNPDNPAPSLGYGAAGPATSGGFPALDNSGTNDAAAPDYFSEDAADASPDYFSSDDSSSYDDSSSDDVGGGGFDDPNNNSGSW
ncbi:TPM domain-containing protein [Hymenobacter metallicola]|uniref:TPM domain-containing protein n=1 Tax=Hymenobacter metallicola TaxID=2563114 RepID=A0A4Z0QDE9_9BACT|nr:TPM domain-containing protein [Hymenobacter metallicola]TGE27724.1 TPM domain-containing protein [Hymenobacter metallicola]